MSTDFRELKDLESALARLAPAPSRVDRDCLLHAAGRVEGERAAQPWKWATAGLATTAVVFACWALTTAPRVEQRIVYIPAPDQISPATEYKPDAIASPRFHELEERGRAAPSGFLAPSSVEARWRVLRFGPEALPDAAWSISAGAQLPQRTLEQDLGMPRNSFRTLNNRQSKQATESW